MSNPVYAGVSPGGRTASAVMSCTPAIDKRHKAPEDFAPLRRQVDRLAGVIEQC